MEPVTWIMLIGLAAVIGGVIFVRRQSETKGKWGLDSFGGTDCPRCGERLQMMR